MANYIYDQESGELYHYGVKGMKWGQHIFGVDKMYSKASKRMAKLESRYDRAIGASEKWKRRANSSGQTLAAISNNRKKLEEAIVDANKKKDYLDSIDSKSLNWKDRRTLVKAKESANAKVQNANKALNDSLLKEQSLKDQAVKDTKKYLMTKRVANRRQKKMERFRKAMNTAFSDIDSKTVQAGKSVVDSALKKDS